jgi:hypothetical protein
MVYVKGRKKRQAEVAFSLPHKFRRLVLNDF